MKAIIPVAGADQHAHPAYHIPSRPLIPVGDKPILGHIIENLLKAGIEEQIFVVGAFKEYLKEYISEHYPQKLQATYIEQSPRRGLAHAIWVCRNEIKSEREILITLGDTIFEQETHTIINTPGSVLGVHEVDTPHLFGIALTDQQQRVISVSEKPKIPVSNLALVGLYKFDHIPMLLEVLDQLLHQPPQNGDTYSLTEAIMSMINRGVSFKTHTVEAWYDCGSKKGTLLANRILLQRLASVEAVPHDKNIIIPPVYIAPHANIHHCIIGPYVSIGENASLTDTIVRNSVISSRTHMHAMQLQNAMRLNLNSN